MRLLLRIVINVVAIWVGAYVVDGLDLSGSVLNWVVVAIIFGLVNALIRPIVRLFSLPITFLTLGLFTFVINALMLMLTGWLSGFVGDGGLSVDGFLPALWGSIIISIVSTVLNWFLPD